MNKVTIENSKPGDPSCQWDLVNGLSSPDLEGFTTDISVNLGETVFFKIKTSSILYRLDIYRLGFYGGMGARKITTIRPSASLPQIQPAPIEDSSTHLKDYGNWSISAFWTVPREEISGIYFAKLVREDAMGANHIVFIVRDDEGNSDLLFQTSDTTWQAYNDHDTHSLYSSPRAFKVSYNRPFQTRQYDYGANWLFNAEYPMVRWLEANGYDVSYCSGIDTDRSAARIFLHKIFLSVGHDEYWSAAQRANVEAARDAGIHLAFFSGNEVYWRIRWEESIDGESMPYRTLVCYKETAENSKIDPSAEWTGTWRDPRFNPAFGGGWPENELTGTLTVVPAGLTKDPIRVAPEYGQLRFWRHTDIASLNVGDPALDLALSTLGYEWNGDIDNGFRPGGLMRLASTTLDQVYCLNDYGSSYSLGTATHHVTLYRHHSGALVFSAGTVQWSWGLDNVHDVMNNTVKDMPGPRMLRMQQATVNLFADMGVQPENLQTGLVASIPSADNMPPESHVTSPVDGAVLQPGEPILIEGTANDSDGAVGAVEISTNGGVTWHPAMGHENWSYSWVPGGNGKVTLMSRAVDDSGNIEVPISGITVTVGQDTVTPLLLVINSAWRANLFSDYLTEILRAEGLVAFQKIELATLLTQADPAVYLNKFRILVLAETKLLPDQQQVMRAYVSGGGNLIAMRPDPEMADLFGLSFSSLRQEQPLAPLQFFAFDTTAGPGKGLTTSSLQYHGSADNYDLSGATALGYFFNSISTPSVNPAITVNNVGAGKAAAFLFDLAKSIVLMRQGNPEWKNTEGDGAMGITQDNINGINLVEPLSSNYRPMDMFVRLQGEIWFSPEHLEVPQADEQQRFLANLILDLIKVPTPRIWYLPALNKTLIVNTGDAENYSQNTIEATLTDIEKYRGSFSVYLTRGQIPGLVNKAAVDAWYLRGHGAGVHTVGTMPVSPPPPNPMKYNSQTFERLNIAYDDIIKAFEFVYKRKVRTARNHTIDWTGWTEMAQIEAEHGTRMDLNYYHYWQFDSVTNRAKFPTLKLPIDKTKAHGYFTGSGLPQRFCDEKGKLVPIYQLLTEWSDEYFADNSAISGVANGYVDHDVVQIIIEMLIRAQNGYYSAFVNNIHPGRYVSDDPVTKIWTEKMWAFAAANLIPLWSAEKFLDFTEARNVASISNLDWNGTTLTFDFQTIASGQEVTLMLPTENLLSIEVDNVSVLFTKDTLAGRQYALFTIKTATAHIVAHYPKSWIETTLSDFNGGNPDAVQILSIGDGALTLGGKIFLDNFDASSSLQWESLPATGSPGQNAIWNVADNAFIHEFNSSTQAYHPVILSAANTPAGDFSFMCRQRIMQVNTGPGDIGVLGFIIGGRDANSYFIIQYAQRGLGLKIYRHNIGLGNFVLVAQATLPDPVVGHWYHMMVEAVGTIIRIFVDGELKLVTNIPAYSPGRVGLLGYCGSRNAYKDVIITTELFSQGGIYISKAFDAGLQVNWENLVWEQENIYGTVLAFAVRTGETSLPDSSWTAFTPIKNSGDVLGLTSQYIQYRVILATGSNTLPPILKQVRVIYSDT